jgi:hypothetical protein
MRWTSHPPIFPDPQRIDLWVRIPKLPKCPPTPKCPPSPTKGSTRWRRIQRPKANCCELICSLKVRQIQCLVCIIAVAGGWPRTMALAEGVGFEPTIRFPVYTLSKRAPSATRPSLRARQPANIAARFRVTTRATYSPAMARPNAGATLAAIERLLQHPLLLGRSYFFGKLHALVLKSRRRKSEAE